MPPLPASAHPPGSTPLAVVRVPQLGDFGLTRGTGLAMALVRWGTLSRWGHACLAVGDADDLGRVQIVEAMPDGVRMHAASVAEWVWSDVALTDAQRVTITGRGLDLVGEPYDWPAIGGFLLRWAGARLRGHSADHADRRTMCSELVAWCYRQAGVDLIPGVAAGDISPGDLAEYLVEH